MYSTYSLYNYEITFKTLQHCQKLSHTEMLIFFLRCTFAFIGWWSTEDTQESRKGEGMWQMDKGLT